MESKALGLVIAFIIGAVLLWVVFSGGLTKGKKIQNEITNQSLTLCEQANGKCVVPEGDACPGGRVKLSGSLTCKKTAEGKDQICCQRLPSDQ